jgi:hypothetical protein
VGQVVNLRPIVIGLWRAAPKMRTEGGCHKTEKPGVIVLSANSAETIRFAGGFVSEIVRQKAGELENDASNWRRWRNDHQFVGFVRAIRACIRGGIAEAGGAFYEWHDQAIVRRRRRADPHDATAAQLPQMLPTLLAERFKLPAVQTKTNRVDQIQRPNGRE